MEIEPDNPLDVTEERAAQRWREMAVAIDGLVTQLADPAALSVTDGSSVAGDDRRTAPYQLSHAVLQCVTTAADHLHAAKSLVVDQNLVHTAATTTLGRGAIEGAATALWLLTPARRADRVVRTLQWYAQNLRDQNSASPIPEDDLDRREGQLQRLAAAVAPSTRLSGYTMTRVLQEVDQIDPDLGLLLNWRVASGFAHGRPWAYLSVLDREVLNRAEGVQTMRLTSDLRKALGPSQAGLLTLQRALGLARDRGLS